MQESGRDPHKGSIIGRSALVISLVLVVSMFAGAALTDNGSDTSLGAPPWNSSDYPGFGDTRGKLTFIQNMPTPGASGTVTLAPGFFYVIEIAGAAGAASSSNPVSAIGGRGAIVTASANMLYTDTAEPFGYTIGGNGNTFSNVAARGLGGTGGGGNGGQGQDDSSPPSGTDPQRGGGGGGGASILTYNNNPILVAGGGGGAGSVSGNGNNGGGNGGGGGIGTPVPSADGTGIVYPGTAGNGTGNSAAGTNGGGGAGQTAIGTTAGSWSRGGAAVNNGGTIGGNGGYGFGGTGASDVRGSGGGGGGGGYFGGGGGGCGQTGPSAGGGGGGGSSYISNWLIPTGTPRANGVGSTGYITIAQYAIVEEGKIDPSLVDQTVTFDPANPTAQQNIIETMARIIGVDTGIEVAPDPNGVSTDANYANFYLKFTYRDSYGNPSDTAPVNAGVYDVVISFDHPRYILPESQSYTVKLTVKPAELVKPSAKDVERPYDNGEAVYLVLEDLWAPPIMSVTGDVGFDKGAYEATISFIPAKDSEENEVFNCVWSDGDPSTSFKIPWAIVASHFITGRITYLNTAGYDVLNGQPIEGVQVQFTTYNPVTSTTLTWLSDPTNANGEYRIPFVAYYDITIQGGKRPGHIANMNYPLSGHLPAKYTPDRFVDPVDTMILDFTMWFDPSYFFTLSGNVTLTGYPSRPIVGAKITYMVTNNGVSIESSTLTGDYGRYEIKVAAGATVEILSITAIGYMDDLTPSIADETLTEMERIPRARMLTDIPYWPFTLLYADGFHKLNGEILDRATGLGIPGVRIDFNIRTDSKLPVVDELGNLILDGIPSTIIRSGYTYTDINGEYTILVAFDEGLAYYEYYSWVEITKVSLFGYVLTDPPDPWPDPPASGTVWTDFQQPRFNRMSPTPGDPEWESWDGDWDNSKIFMKKMFIVYFVLIEGQSYWDFQLVPPDDPYLKDPGTPRMAGYVFQDVWKTQAGDPWDFEAMVTENMILIAEWDRNPLMWIVSVTESGVTHEFEKPDEAAEFGDEPKTEIYRGGQQLEVQFYANLGYTLPGTIVVTMDPTMGEGPALPIVLNAGTDYSWDPLTGKLEIFAVHGDIEITIDGIASGIVVGFWVVNHIGGILTASVGSIQLTPPESMVPSGADVVLKAIPDDDTWGIKGWYLNGVPIPGSTPGSLYTSDTYTITNITESATVTVEYYRITHIVTFEIEGPGSIQAGIVGGQTNIPSGQAVVTKQTVRFYASPYLYEADTYRIKEWWVDGVRQVGAESEYLNLVITKDTHVKAVLGMDIVSGTVFDVDTYNYDGMGNYKGLEGVEIWGIDPDSGDTVILATTDANGYYEFEHPVTTPVDITKIVLPGYIMDPTSTYYPPVHFNERSRDHPNVDFFMTTYSIVSGTVTNELPPGVALEGVIIDYTITYVVKDEDDNDVDVEIFGSLATDSSGYYEFKLPTRMTVVINDVMYTSDTMNGYNVAGSSPSTLPWTIRPVDPKTADFKLLGFFRVSGIVTAENTGNVLPNVAIEYEISTAPGTIKTVMTDSNGRYTIPEVINEGQTVTITSAVLKNYRPADLPLVITSLLDPMDIVMVSTFDVIVTISGDPKVPGEPVNDGTVEIYVNGVKVETYTGNGTHPVIAVDAGSSVTFVARDGENISTLDGSYFMFRFWELDGSVITDRTHPTSGGILMNAELTIEAAFAPSDVRYTVTSSIQYGLDEDFSTKPDDWPDGFEWSPPSGMISPPNVAPWTGGSFDVEIGSDVLFTMTPGTNWHIVAIIIDGVVIPWDEISSSAALYTLYVVDDTTFIAVYEPDPYIWAGAGPNGTINPAGNVTAKFGHDKVFTITADEYYTIGYLEIGNLITGERDSWTGPDDPGWPLTQTGPREWTYTFKNVIQNGGYIEVEFVVDTSVAYAVTVIVGPGGAATVTTQNGAAVTNIIEGSRATIPVPHGTGILLEATNSIGYRFLYWTIATNTSVADRSHELTPTSDMTITAVFAPDSNARELIVSAVGDGAVSWYYMDGSNRVTGGIGTYNVPLGAEIFFLADDTAGSDTFSHWAGGSAGVSILPAYYHIMTVDATVTAYFYGGTGPGPTGDGSFNITVTIVGSGTVTATFTDAGGNVVSRTVSAATSEIMVYGNPTLTAAAGTDYTFSHWADTNVVLDGVYTPAVYVNYAVTAFFYSGEEEDGSYVITVIVDHGGTATVTFEDEHGNIVTQTIVGYSVGDERPSLSRKVTVFGTDVTFFADRTEGLGTAPFSHWSIISDSFSYNEKLFVTEIHQDYVIRAVFYRGDGTDGSAIIEVNIIGEGIVYVEFYDGPGSSVLVRKSVTPDADDQTVYIFGTAITFLAVGAGDPEDPESFFSHWLYTENDPVTLVPGAEKTSAANPRDIIVAGGQTITAYFYAGDGEPIPGTGGSSYTIYVNVFGDGYVNVEFMDQGDPEDDSKPRNVVTIENITAATSGAFVVFAKPGDMIGFTATGTGAVFSHWTSTNDPTFTDNVLFVNPYDAAIIQNYEISAHFYKGDGTDGSYEIDVSKVLPTSGKVDVTFTDAGGVEVTLYDVDGLVRVYGEDVTFTATGTGTTFSHWADNTRFSITDNPYDATVGVGYGITAYFYKGDGTDGSYTIYVYTEGAGTVDVTFEDQDHNMVTVPDVVGPVIVYGTEVTFTATGDGTTFSHWVDDTGLVATYNPYDTTIIQNYKITGYFYTGDGEPEPDGDGSYTIYVYTEGDGTVSVTFEDQNNNIVTLNNVSGPTVVYGKDVTFAAAGTGTTFTHWIDGDKNVATDNPYDVEIFQGYMITAHFYTGDGTDGSYTIHVNKEGIGKVNVTFTDQSRNTVTLYDVDVSHPVVVYGTAVTFTATGVGTTFSHWVDGDKNVATDNPYDVTISQDYEITAYFYTGNGLDGSYTIRVDKEGTGTVDVTFEDQNNNMVTFTNVIGTVIVYGEDVTFTATGTGTTFSHWVDDTGLVATDNPYDAVIVQNYEITAYFYTGNGLDGSYTIRVDKEGTGTVDVTFEDQNNNMVTLYNVSGRVIVYGTNVTFDATGDAVAGTSFSHWALSDGTIEADDSYDVTIWQNMTITAFFYTGDGSDGSWTVTVDIEGSGSVDVTFTDHKGNVVTVNVDGTGRDIVVYGGGVAFKAIPGAASVFTNWVLDGEIIFGTQFPPSGTINVNSDMDITARFVPSGTTFTVTSSIQYGLNIDYSGVPGRTGTISPPNVAPWTGGSFSVPVNTYVDFTMSPGASWHIVAIIVNGEEIPWDEISGADVYYSLWVIDNATIIAVYEPDPFIFASAGPNGEIDPAGNVTVGYNDNMLFTITADKYYTVDKVTIKLDGVPTEYTDVSTSPLAPTGVDGQWTFEFENVINNSNSIIVTFKIDKDVAYEVEVTAGTAGSPGGNVTVSFKDGADTVVITVLSGETETIAVPKNTEITVVANPSVPLSSFVYWTITAADTTYPAASTQYITPVMDMTIGATFALTVDTYLLDVSVIGDGDVSWYYITATGEEVTGNTGVYRVLAGAEVTFLSNASGDSWFSHWSNGFVTSTDDPYVPAPITQNYAIAAYFYDGSGDVPGGDGSYLITVNVDGIGSVTIEFTDQDGLLVTRTIASASARGEMFMVYGKNPILTADDTTGGDTFSHWAEGEDGMGITGKVFTPEVFTGYEVTAYFYSGDGTDDSFTIRINVGVFGEGTVDVTFTDIAGNTVTFYDVDGEIIVYGENVTFTAKNGDETFFSHWVDDRGNVSQDNPYHAVVYQDYEITVFFYRGDGTDGSYTIIVLIEGNGTVTATFTDTVGNVVTRIVDAADSFVIIGNTDVTLRAVNGPGIFSHWFDGVDDVVVVGDTYFAENIHQHYVVTAYFYDGTGEPGGDGSFLITVNVNNSANGYVTAEFTDQNGNKVIQTITTTKTFVVLRDPLLKAFETGATFSHWFDGAQVMVDSYTPEVYTGYTTTAYFYTGEGKPESEGGDGSYTINVNVEGVGKVDVMFRDEDGNFITLYDVVGSVIVYDTNVIFFAYSATETFSHWFDGNVVTLNSYTTRIVQNYTITAFFYTGEGDDGPGGDNSYTIYVYKEGNGKVNVTFVDQKGNFVTLYDVEEGQVIVHGTEVIFTATGVGTKFSHWVDSDGRTSSAMPHPVSIAQFYKITAYFYTGAGQPEPTGDGSYTIHVNKEGNGRVNVSFIDQHDNPVTLYDVSGAVVVYGRNVTFTGAGYDAPNETTFSHWVSGAGLVTTGTSYNVTIAQNYTITAYFYTGKGQPGPAGDDSYTIVVHKEGDGKVDVTFTDHDGNKVTFYDVEGPVIVHGTDVTFTARDSETETFSHWFDGEVSVNNPHNATVHVGYEITTYFYTGNGLDNSYTINVGIVGDGSVKVSFTDQDGHTVTHILTEPSRYVVMHGTIAVFEAVDGTDAFSHWSNTGDIHENPHTVTIYQDYEIIAYFTPEDGSSSMWMFMLLFIALILFFLWLAFILLHDRKLRIFKVHAETAMIHGEDEVRWKHEYKFQVSGGAKGEVRYRSGLSEQEENWVWKTLTPDEEGWYTIPKEDVIDHLTIELK